MDRPGRLVALCGLLVAMAMGRPLGAQRPVIAEAGFTGARFTDDSASVFGPSLRLSASGSRGNFFGAAEGSTLTTLGAATAFGAISGGGRTTPRGGWSAELAGELSAVAGSKNNTGGAGTGVLSARLYKLASRSGGWLRTSGHASARTNTTLPGGSFDAGAWWNWSRARLSASLAQEWTRAELFTGRFRTGYAGTAPVRYTEASVVLHAEGDRSTLDVATTVRRDPDAHALYERATTASAAVWLSGRTALVFTAAHQLPDWIRGSDAADAFSFGLRFYQSMPSAERVARILPVLQVADSAGQRWVRVRANGARTVEVMGDFTEWEAQPLARRGDVFERSVAIAVGTHRVLLRIDGGEWRTAVNTPAVDDDLGGRAGLLVVP